MQIERVLSAEDIPDGIRARIHAIHSMDRKPTLSLLEGVTREDLLSWVAGLMPTYLTNERIWMATGNPCFPFIKIKPLSKNWLECFFDPNGDLNMLVMSEDQRKIGSFTTEEYSHQYFSDP